MKKAKILIVDDTPANIKILSDTLKEDYKVIVAKNGFEALEHIDSQPLPDLILLDVLMPGITGYEVCQKLKSDARTKDIPVIFITAMNEEADETKGFELGAVDYISKPFSLPIVKERVNTHVQLKQYKDYLEDMVREQTKTIEEEKNHAVMLQKKAERQLELFLMTLASAIESKDKYTGGHVERVANYSRDIAMSLNFPEEDVRRVYLGAIVHDLGKIGIQDAILNKKGKLDVAEFDRVKEHTSEGHKLLGRIEDIETAALIALSHQEKWDGTGYPQGLKGEDIPLEARIVTIADYWDAIITDRPYRKAMKLKDAIEIMYQERGKTFDPDIFDVFMDENNKIYLRYISDENLKELE